MKTQNVLTKEIFENMVNLDLIAMFLNHRFKIKELNSTLLMTLKQKDFLKDKLENGVIMLDKVKAICIVQEGVLPDDKIIIVKDSDFFESLKGTKSYLSDKYINESYKQSIKLRKFT